MTEPVPTTTAKAKKEAQSAGVKFGCHIELDPGQEPDGCVKDYGDDSACVYAARHRSREACRYWQPVNAKVTA